MSRIDVNVVMHNCEPFLRQALDSILAQTWQDWRAIIIDDISTDNSAAMAQEYVDRDPRFVLHKLDAATRRPYPYARNIALGLSRAKWIAVLDGDDWWEPWKLERQLAALEQAGPGKLLCATGMLEWSNNAVQACWTATTTEQIAQQLPLRDVIAHSTVLMDREAVLKLGGYDESMHTAQDWDLWLRMLRTYGPDIFLMVQKPSLYYRKHDINVTGNKLRCLRYEWRIVRRSLKYELWKQRNPRAARFILDFWLNRSVATCRKAGHPRGAAGWALLAILTSPWKKERWVQAGQACKTLLTTSPKPAELEALASKL